MSNEFIDTLPDRELTDLEIAKNNLLTEQMRLEIGARVTLPLSEQFAFAKEYMKTKEFKQHWDNFCKEIK
jgi:hypothetical protein